MPVFVLVPLGGAFVALFFALTVAGLLADPVRRRDVSINMIAYWLGMTAMRPALIAGAVTIPLAVAATSLVV